ncbi:uncharacterized protein LOC127246815 [Andrographis paniculata]|uniref:uncharacterized protein LOC127246815 n=1 Tax=Andrographis paniculata TaxID=175694 RepID=UPI0021E6F81A|nr:uncharacterized protein LOC127246815 [Andrographis paniculata]
MVSSTCDEQERDRPLAFDDGMGQSKSRAQSSNTCNQTGMTKEDENLAKIVYEKLYRAGAWATIDDEHTAPEKIASLEKDTSMEVSGEPEDEREEPQIESPKKKKIKLCKKYPHLPEKFKFEDREEERKKKLEMKKKEKDRELEELFELLDNQLIGYLFN